MKYINYFAVVISIALVILIWLNRPVEHYQTAWVTCSDGICFIEHNNRTTSVDETELINYKQQMLHDCAIEGHRVVFKRR